MIRGKRKITVVFLPTPRSEKNQEIRWPLDFDWYQDSYRKILEYSLSVEVFQVRMDAHALKQFQQLL